MCILSSEQYSRNANIEIKSVPTEPSENLATLLEKTGDQIVEPVAKDDIEICHRLFVINSSLTKIVVQFVHRAKRSSVLEKAR